MFPFRLYKAWAWLGKNIGLYSVVEVSVEVTSVNTECLYTWVLITMSLSVCLHAGALTGQVLCHPDASPALGP